MESNFFKELLVILQNVLYLAISSVIPVLVSYGVRYLKVKREEKLSKIENEYVKDTLEQATNIIFNVVDAVTQTYVDDLKKEGTFDLEKQKIALNKALTQVKSLMNEEVTDLIVEKYNDADEWIRSQIEAYIKNTKVTLK
jgi:hypothetical protein